MNDSPVQRLKGARPLVLPPGAPRPTAAAGRSRVVPHAIQGTVEGLGAALSNVRARDVLVLQGPPIVGLVFGWGVSVQHSVWMLPVFLFASGLLVAHIFCLNDWADIERDHRDVNKARHTFTTQGTSLRAMALLTLGLGTLSLGLFNLLPWPTFVTAVGLIALSILYSHPFVAAKGIPILSSLLHVVGGVLHFVLGYSVFQGIDRRGILVGVYFGVVFAAGHLTQEVGDADADRRSRIRTNAVAFGKRRTFWAAFLLFTVSYGIIFGLGYAGVVPRALMSLAVLYPVQALWFGRVLRSDLTFDGVSAYRSRYRMLFGLIGLIMCATLLARGIGP
jgi:4-hydroxybenzoate polyprenyltransferase